MLEIDAQKPAVLYLREDALKKVPFALQESEARRHADQIGCEVVAVFRDHADGMSLERPELQHMYDFLQQWDGPPVTVIVTRPDRLARSMQAIEKIKNAILMRNAVISYPGGEMNGSAESNLEVRLVAAMEEYEELFEEQAQS